MIDLSFLSEKPVFDTRNLMVIDCLAPVSLCTKQVGKYFLSHEAPTEFMLLGLMENALGWYFLPPLRKQIQADLEKLHKKEWGEMQASPTGFVSVLQYHVNFGTIYKPPVKRFMDYWSRSYSDTSISFIDGSRNYDYSIAEFMTRYRKSNSKYTKEHAGEVRIGGNAGSLNDMDMVRNRPHDIPHGRMVEAAPLVREFFPIFSQSPTEREYVVPQEPYKIVVETSQQVAALLAGAFENPQGSLYLGHSEGAVEVQWQCL